MKTLNACAFHYGKMGYLRSQDKHAQLSVWIPSPLEGILAINNVYEKR